MQRNRIVYNTQGLFLAPYSGESWYSINNGKILKRIERVQSFEYSIENNRVNIDAFGANPRVYRGVTQSPMVDFSFEYIPDGLTNENRLNLSVGHFLKPKMELMFSGICNSGFLDKKDFYLAINQNNSDVNRYGAITASTINPTLESQIIDKNSKDYSLIHFQNCYINKYSFQTSIDGLPIIRQDYVADNLAFYLSGSGINYTILNTKSGNLEVQIDKVIIPMDFSYTDPNLSGQNILNSKDANISFETQNSTGSNFYTETIQGFRFEVNFNRREIRSLNHKFIVDRPFSFPVNAELQADLLITGEISGSFFNTLDQDKDYNIVLNFNSNQADINPTKFIFSGCRFNNIVYKSSIGESKRANLSFNLDIDSDFGKRGIFASGNILYTNIANIKQVYN